jgi:UDP-N-acetylglucosamine 3-dehydrogenase
MKEPMKPLSTAVVGCGVWGRNHARVYKQIPDIQLKTVVDADETKAREIGELYKVEWSTDAQKVFEDHDIDAVSICTPTVTHAEIALKAIKHGKHVLVEKPMTNTLEEAKKLIETAEKHAVQLAVGFVERFNPAVNEAMNLIDQGKIGDVILAHTRRVSRRPLRIGDVGVIKDLAIHDIDIVNNLFPEEPDSVFCTAGSIAHAFEDYANINLRYDGNRNAFIETNWLTPRIVRNLTITGSEGIITVHYRTQEITVENNEQLIQPFLPYKEPLYLELQSFTNAVMNDTTPEVTGEDGLNALRICEAALRSAKTGETVNLEDIK